MSNKFANLSQRAAEAGNDFTKTTKGGGDGPRVPAAGKARARFVGYVELGMQETRFKDVVEDKPRVLLTFELSGKNHAPRDIDGKKVPWLISLEETLSRNEKANLSKTFKSMNYDQRHVHFSGMLGDPFLVEVFHRKYPRRGEDKSNPASWTGIAAELRQKGMPYSISAPKGMDAEGDEITLQVDPPLTPLRCFVWDFADKEQWDSLFIDGTYPEVKDDKGNVILPERSRNFLQERIKKAKNFAGSPIAALLGGVSVADLGTPDPDPTNGADMDDDIPF
jgi:hypothetical protein